MIINAFTVECPDVILIEGQGALSHPAISTLSFILRAWPRRRSVHLRSHTKCCYHSKHRSWIERMRLFSWSSLVTCAKALCRTTWWPLSARRLVCPTSCSKVSALFGSQSWQSAFSAQRCTGIRLSKSVGLFVIFARSPCGACAIRFIGLIHFEPYKQATASKIDDEVALHEQAGTQYRSRAVP